MTSKVSQSAHLNLRATKKTYSCTKVITCQKAQRNCSSLSRVMVNGSPNTQNNTQNFHSSLPNLEGQEDHEDQSDSDSESDDVQIQHWR
eukprot:10384209-Karenia_brevis.AAC.1